MKFALTLSLLFGTFASGAFASQDRFSGNQLGHPYVGLQPSYVWDTSVPIENTATAATFTSAAPMSLSLGNGPVPATYSRPFFSYYQPPISHMVSSPVSERRTSGYRPSTGLAQQKANQAARMRLRGHVGGGLGGARFEGVGWSNASAQSAIQSCCYWGTRPTHQIGVSRGADGFWYACVLYN